jgi:hypothetical protein
MKPERREYRGHRIELRPPDDESLRASATPEETLELLIDDEPIRHGRFPDGLFFLEDYAYDWSDDLLDVATKLIDYRQRAGEGHEGP